MARPSGSRPFEALPAIPRSRARRHTALYRLKTPSHQIALVLSALAEGLDPSAAPRVAGLPSNDVHHLAMARWAARSKLSRALFPSSPASLSPVGRTAHEAALRQAGTVAVADHRPHDEDTSCPAAGSAYTTCGPYRDPFSPTNLGRLSACHSLPAMG